MSYSSLGSDMTKTRRTCESCRAIQEISAETGLTPAAIMLAFNTRNHDLCALFGSSSYEHIKTNLAGIGTDITPFLEKINAVSVFIQSLYHGLEPLFNSKVTSNFFKGVFTDLFQCVIV